MDRNRLLIENTINRVVDTLISERVNRGNAIDMLIENTINENLDMLLEKHTPKKERKKKKKSDSTMRNKRKLVLQWLRSPEVNKAEVRRMLEGEPESQSEEDGRRSLFMKKVNQTHGKRFNDNEINHLYSIRSSFGS